MFQSESKIRLSGKNLPDIYFLPEWINLFQEHDKGAAKFFEFKNKVGYIYYQFIVRPVPHLIDNIKYYDTITTYGFNGPIILECDVLKKERLLEEFDKAFQTYCDNNNIIAEYIRFNPWIKNHSDFQNIYIVEQSKYHQHTFFTDLTCHDFFWEEFSSKARNQIRKSQKIGVRIEFDYNGSSIDEFQRLYELTAKKNNVSEYYLFDTEFLIKTFHVLKDKQFIINAIFENRYISSAIFLHHGDYLHYHLCANDPQYYYVCANSSILYEGAKWGRDHGKTQMHLGGVNNEKLFTFKRNFFKKGVCDFYIGKKIRNRNVYDALVNIKSGNGGIDNKDYFPLYRG